MHFSQRINLIMTERDVSAYRISKDTGISDRLVGYWRSGEKQPNSDNLVKLADYFSVSVDYLLGRTDDPKVTVLSGTNTTADDKERRSVVTSGAVIDTDKGDEQQMQMTNLARSAIDGFYNKYLEKLHATNDRSVARFFGEAENIVQDVFPEMTLGTVEDLCTELCNLELLTKTTEPKERNARVGSEGAKRVTSYWLTHAAIIMYENGFDLAGEKSSADIMSTLPKAE